ncbi:hypothetical protein CIG75_00475 [Tumebacillus algifaecis]|uniref:Uncharacterized protein n=1 Tax=Tumebacillus algifaecis TaxID=1214604 RepID=A0A223CW92_9BACL|nr:hypothetical protein [Tumebacillus algifaecis]ASS73598.1 hypothetical protein CIG75_00475 [Tumebacillus algifaecis]
MTTPHNICLNSVFLTEQIKLDLNHMLHHYFEEVRSLFQAKGIPAVVYTGGSLARQEPSIRWTEDDELRLFSDIDFVVHTTLDYQADPWLKNLESYLKQHYPQFNSTVALVSDLSNASGFFSRDIALAQRYPIYESFQVERVVPDAFDATQMFNVMIHQISNTFLHPQWSGLSKGAYFRPEARYHYIKLILECLRTQFRHAEDDVVGYYSVYYKRNDPRLQHILDPESIAILIEARELFGTLELPELDIIKILKASMLIHLGFDRTDVTDQELRDRLEELSLRSSHIIPSYRYALLALMFSLGEDRAGQQAYLALFSEILRRMETTDIIAVKADLHILTDNTWSEPLTLHNDAFRELLKTLILLRRDYVRQWRRQVTGEDKIPDLYNDLLPAKG